MFENKSETRSRDNFIHLTFFQAPAAPTLSFWPRPSSSSSSGIPTTISMMKNGIMNAPVNEKSGLYINFRRESISKGVDLNVYL